MKCAKDDYGVSLQGIAPTRIVAIASGGTFTPLATDSAFRVPAETTYQINGAGELGTLLDGAVTCIVPGQTYKLTTGMNIEVG